MTLAAVTTTYAAARRADRHGWPKLVSDAYCAHLEAITAALASGHTGAEVDRARALAR